MTAATVRGTFPTYQPPFLKFVIKSTRKLILSLEKILSTCVLLKILKAMPQKKLQKKGVSPCNVIKFSFAHDDIYQLIRDGDNLYDFFARRQSLNTRQGRRKLLQIIFS